MKRLLADIRAGHFDEDTSLLDGIDTQDAHYMAMRRPTYSDNRCHVVTSFGFGGSTTTTPTYAPFIGSSTPISAR